MHITFTVLRAITDNLKHLNGVTLVQWFTDHSTEDATQLMPSSHIETVLSNYIFQSL